MPILALLTAFVSGGRRELVTPHADTRRNIPVVVPAQSQLLFLRVCLVALPAACRVTFRPVTETPGADAVLPAKCPDHADRTLGRSAHSRN